MLDIVDGQTSKHLKKKFEILFLTAKSSAPHSLSHTFNTLCIYPNHIQHPVSHMQSSPTSYHNTLTYLINHNQHSVKRGEEKEERRGRRRIARRK